MGSYRFAGTADSHRFQTDVDSTPFPTVFPWTIIGWATYEDIATNNNQPFSMEVDGDANANRVQISLDVSAPEIAFVYKSGVSTYSSSVALPQGFANHQWLLHCFSLESATMRVGRLGYKGAVSQSSVSVTSASAVTMDRVTFGFLPFFGNLNAHLGQIGPWGFWNRTVGLPELMKMAQGESLFDFSDGLVSGWDFDGRHNAATIPSINGQLDLTTVAGPPTFKLMSPQRAPRVSRIPAVPVAGGTTPKGPLSNPFAGPFAGAV